MQERLVDFEDNAVIPTRGQSIIVRASHICKTISYATYTFIWLVYHYDGFANIADVAAYDGHIIPRFDGTVILSTFYIEYNMYDESSLNYHGGLNRLFLE